MSRKPKAPFEDSPAAAVEAATRLLARREHGAWELRIKLERKGFGADSIAAACAELKARDYLNETRYALMLARHRAAQGRGPRWVEAELQAQHINDADCAAALAQEEIDWLSACRQAARRLKADDPRRREKLYQRGFVPAQIQAVLPDS